MSSSSQSTQPSHREIVSALLQGNDFAGAETYLSQLLIQNPNNPVILYNRGVSRYSQNKLADAKSDFERAARIYEQQHHYGHAIDMYTKALAYFQDDAGFLSQRGKCYLLRGGIKLNLGDPNGMKSDARYAVRDLTRAKMLYTSEVDRKNCDDGLNTVRLWMARLGAISQQLPQQQVLSRPVANNPQHQHFYPYQQPVLSQYQSSASSSTSSMSFSFSSPSLPYNYNSSPLSTSFIFRNLPLSLSSSASVPSISLSSSGSSLSSSASLPSFTPYSFSNSLLSSRSTVTRSSYPAAVNGPQVMSASVPPISLSSSSSSLSSRSAIIRRSYPAATNSPQVTAVENHADLLAAEATLPESLRGYRPSSWSHAQVMTWLKNLGRAFSEKQIISKMEGIQIGGLLLLQLTPDNLRELEIPGGLAQHMFLYKLQLLKSIDEYYSQAEARRQAEHNI